MSSEKRGIIPRDLSEHSIIQQSTRSRSPDQFELRRREREFQENFQGEKQKLHKITKFMNKFVDSFHGANISRSEYNKIVQQASDAVAWIDTPAETRELIGAFPIQDAFEGLKDSNSKLSEFSKQLHAYVDNYLQEQEIAEKLPLLEPGSKEYSGWEE
jgi:hypothetical protein